MIARFQVDVDRRPGCAGSRLPKGDHLGMRAAGLFMPAFAYDRFALHDDAADAWIGRGGVKAVAGKRERPRHHGVVEGAEGGHFLPRRRGDFTSCTASRNSSGDSKLRYTEAKRM